MVAPGMIVAQMAKWLPVWLTPMWVIAAGIIVGALACLIVYGVLAALSIIPGLGSLPDSPKRGVIASLIVGGAIAGALCWQYVPGDDEYSESLFLPLICIGVVTGFGLVYGMWHRTRNEWATILGEGIVPYLLGVAFVLTFVGLVATLWVKKPMDFLTSIPAVNLVGDGTRTVVVELPAASEDLTADEAPFLPANLDYDVRNMAGLTITTDRTINLADSADPAGFSRPATTVFADSQLRYRYEDRDVPPIPATAANLHIQNREILPAKVVFEFQSLPPVPEAATIVNIAIAFFLLMTSIVAFRQAAPRIWALALSTAKNEMAQTLYLILLAIGIFGVIVFAIYPFNTLGDDIRMFKDSGVTLIMVLGMIQAVWSAGTTVSEEIEGRTALTVLSKPVSRRSFIVGKYAGIMMAVLVLFVIIAAVFIVLMAYKPIYDARETSKATPIWQLGLEEIHTTIPALSLYFMETMVIGAIAVALATRLPLLANFITCFVVYVIGNLTSPLVASAQGNNELVGFVGKLIAVIIPNLNVFNVQSAVDAGNQIPPIYLAGAFNYLVCFVIAIWMLAMLLFEDRDLA
ncbi:MAG: ABC transporter permease [Pirellulaceae bacterium]|nr:ABC transporter permease [Pirellulaceae bacterium]